MEACWLGGSRWGMQRALKISEFITAGCAVRLTSKASSKKGSLISSSVPFQVVPILLPRKFLLLPPLISGENSNEWPPGHPPSGMQERGWSMSQNPQSVPWRAAQPKPLSPATQNESIAFKSNSCTRRPVQERSQQHCCKQLQQPATTEWLLCYVS